jgi:hypothetical protein
MNSVHDKVTVESQLQLVLASESSITLGEANQ